MIIKANGKEYNLEYTFEAALDKKCVDMCWNYFSGAYMVKGQAIDDVENKTVAKVMTVDKLIGGMADVPAMVLHLFYAGLLENHSDIVQSEEDAKVIFKEFRKENKGDERATFAGMMNAIRVQMEEDGFFNDIGLQNFMDSMKEQELEKPQKPVKTPADHKKKSSPSAN